MSFSIQRKAALISPTSMMLMLSLAAAQAAPSPPLQGDPSCAGLAAAMLANAKTPYRSMSIITLKAGDDSAPAMTQTSETISTRTAVFARFGSSKWQQVQIPIYKLMEAVRRSAESFSGCRRLPDDPVNGKPAAVYTGHILTQKSVVDTKIWVDAARGIMLRSETEVTATTPDAGDILKGRHVAIRYSYDNVVPPPIDR